MADETALFARCNKYVDHALTKSPMVRFVLDGIAARGCKLADPPVQCGTIHQNVAGVFDGDAKKVVINTLASKSQSVVSRTVVHELIHAFDMCRVRFDMDNVKHLACTEIRAANLSTDCNFSNEVVRGHYTLQGQQQKCVRRRAALSIKDHAACAGKDPHRVVDAVFERCYKDTEPFGGIPT